MMDILPTFIKLAGGQPPADRRLDGCDIWPMLAGQQGADSPHDVFYFFRGLNLEAVRHGPWKLRLQANELYNLDADIGEQNNVAQDHADVVRQLRHLAEQMDADLGQKGLGTGCRPLGKVQNPQPLMDRDGKIRDGFQ
jgi:arylsulfatase A-like enzyme